MRKLTTTLCLTFAVLFGSAGMGQLYAGIAATFCLLGMLGAIIATILEYGFLWGLATFGEIFLGGIVVAYVPEEIRVIGLVLSPIAVIVILGAVFGFWYI